MWLFLYVGNDNNRTHLYIKISWKKIRRFTDKAAVPLIFPKAESATYSKLEFLSELSTAYSAGQCTGRADSRGPVAAEIATRPVRQTRERAGGARRLPSSETGWTLIGVRCAPPIPATATAGGGGRGRPTDLARHRFRSAADAARRGNAKGRARNHPPCCFSPPR